MPQTATRATLDEAWQASRKLLDWMHVPGMADYVNALVSGKSLNHGGHWSLYANEQHLAPLSRKLGRALSMVSLGCGSGHIEASLIREFKWPVDRVLGLEFDEQLRLAATDTFSNIPVDSAFEFLDFNNPACTHGKFDVIFCCHAIHHATDLETFLPFVNSLMHEGSIFLGIDYFGPTRFQVEYETKVILEKLDAALPSELTCDLREDAPRPSPLKFATIKEVREADISESVRSSDLRTLLFSNFPVEELKPMGGTLLRWLLQYRAGNFHPHNPDHLSIAKLLIYIESLLIETKQIRSDDLFFVCRKSSVI